MHARLLYVYFVTYPFIFQTKILLEKASFRKWPFHELYFQPQQFNEIKLIHLETEYLMEIKVIKTLADLLN